MFRNLKEDYRRVSNARPGPVGMVLRALTCPGFRAVALYRAGRWCRNHRLHVLARLLEAIMVHTCHCSVSTLAQIGPGLKIGHCLGLVIGGFARLGRNCRVMQNTTIGGSYGKKDDDGRTQPWIGDDVSISAGAAIIGPVIVGSNSIIGANAVVAKDVPENSIAAGVPARVIRTRGDEGAGAPVSGNASVERPPSSPAIPAQETAR